MPQELLWINGRVVHLSEGRVSVEDRGFNFADGIYEVIRFYDGRPFMMDEHMTRWERSAAGIMMDCTGTREGRISRILELVERSEFRDAHVYGQLTRGASPRKHVFPPALTPPTELWFVRGAVPPAPEVYEAGVALSTQPDERWARCDMKTISLLPNVLAKERARRAGGFEALLVREDGTVTECSASNSWCVRGGVVWTHPLTNRILPGITRIAVLAAARNIGVEVREEACSLSDYRTADEAFISSTTMEIMPATLLDGVAIGDGKPGPVTKRLMAAVSELVAEHCGLDVKQSV